MNGTANCTRRSCGQTLGSKDVKAARFSKTDMTPRHDCAMRCTSRFSLPSSKQPRRAPQRRNLSRFACERTRSHSHGCFLGCEGEIAEIGSLLRGAFCPEDEKPASIFSRVRAVCLAGLEMQRSAGLVLLALVGEIALSHIECLGHAFVEMRRNDRAWFHSDVQHHWPQRVICVADLQRDVALTREWEAIGLELTVEYFLIDHDTGSWF